MRLPIRADGELDYTCAIDPLGVRNTALRIVRPLAPEDGDWSLPQALALFDHVAAMKYVPDPLGIDDFVQSPVETLQHRAGNCEALALALCSLCRSVGIPTRMMGLSDGSADGGHLLAQLFIGRYDLDDLPDDLDDCCAPRWMRELYDDDEVLDNMYFETEHGNQWLFFDPVIGEFAGDVEGLVDEGLMWYSGRNSLGWEDAVYFSDGSASCPILSTSTVPLPVWLERVP
jgi:hypothetical protein